MTYTLQINHRWETTPQHLHHAIQNYACLLLDSEWNDECIGFLVLR